jgi:hypothetical protein
LKMIHAIERGVTTRITKLRRDQTRRFRAPVAGPSNPKIGAMPFLCPIRISARHSVEEMQLPRMAFVFEMNRIVATEAGVAESFSLSVEIGVHAVPA